MEISGYGSIFFSQEAEESARANRSKNDDQEGSALGILGGSDTVSISEEARKLAEKMLMEKQEEQERQEQEAQQKAYLAQAGNSSSAKDTQQSGATGTAGAAQGSGGSGGASDTANIEKQIQQVQARMQSIASGNLPEEVKTSQVSVLQAQLNELQQQLVQAQQAA